MHRLTRAETKPERIGLVIHGAARYDFIVWLFTLGGERRLREKMLRLAQLRQGESVLDVGCGTGTLAIMAKRKVGAGGTVSGVDASPEMIAYARNKAKRAGADIAFAEGAAQALPLSDRSVDVVLSTLMLHHLPRKSRPEIVREIRRVLRPGGRFLAVDFVKPAQGRKSFMDRFHRHGFVRLDDLLEELRAAGFVVVRAGPVGERDLHFVLASNGAAATPAGDIEHEDSTRELVIDANGVQAANRHRGGLILAGLALLGALALVALHGAAALSMGGFSLDTNAISLAEVGVAALMLLVVFKLGFLVFAHGLGARLIGRWVGAREE